MQAATQDGFHYGEAGGWTPDIRVSWSTRRLSFAHWETPSRYGLAVVPSPDSIAPGGNTNGVLRALNADANADQTLECLLQGSDAAWPTLNGFELLGLNGRPVSVASVWVTDDALTTLYRKNAVGLPAGERLRFHFAEPLRARQLRLVVFLGRSTDPVGLDNLEFGQGPAAKGPWVSESLRALKPILSPNCPERADILGLDFDPAGRPVVGWTEGNGCGGSGTGWWARKDSSDTWAVHRIGDGTGVSAGDMFSGVSAFALGSTGRPYFFHHRMFCCDAQVYTVRVDLESQPTGPGGEVLYQGRNLGAAVAADGRFTTVPSFVSRYPNLEQPFSLNGTPYSVPVSDLRSKVVFRQGPTGQPHLVYNESGGKVRYQAGSNAPNQILLTSDSYNRGLAMAVDRSNGVHIAASRGQGSGAFNAVGRLVYLHSANGTNWVQEDLGIEGISETALALDAEGNPGLAFITGFETAWFMQRTPGGWTAPERLRERLGHTDVGLGYRDLQLAFGPGNVPHVALFDALTDRVLVLHATSVSAAPAGQLTLNAAWAKDVVGLGVETQITLSVSNASPREVGHVRVTQRFPPEVLVRTVNPPAVRAEGNTYTFELGALGSFETRLITFRLTALDPVRARLDTTAEGLGLDADAPASRLELAGPEFRPEPCVSGCGEPVLSPTRFPPMRAGQPWSVTVRSPNLTPPATLTLDPALLPPGFCLTADGRLQGVPSAADFLDLTWRVGSSALRIERTLEVRDQGAPVGLMAHWPFEAGGREMLQDRPTAWNPRATFPGGAFGSGIQTAFEPGSGPELLSSEATDFPGGGKSGTFLLWVRKDVATGPGSATTPAGTLLSLETADPLRSLHVTALGNAGPLALAWGPADERATIVTGPPLNPGEWHHVALTIEGPRCRLFLDGVAVLNFVVPAPWQPTKRLVAGGFGSRVVFAGTLDELSVWNRVLDTTEIQSWRDQGVPYVDRAAASQGGFAAAVRAEAPTELHLREGEFFERNLAADYCGSVGSFRWLEGTLPEALSLDLSGRLRGVPLRSGRFALVVEADNGHGAARRDLTLVVEPVLPRFYVQPVGSEVLWGERARLWVVATPAAQLQWRRNGDALVGATNAVLNLAGFTAAQVGLYDCVASNAGGSTTSDAAWLQLTQPSAAESGPELSEPALQNDGALRLTFSTVPGRVYQIRRARGDDLAMANLVWDVIHRFTATNTQAAWEDSAALRSDQRFYQVVEEPPLPQAPFSAQDTTRLIPLDEDGTARPGFAVATGPNGTLAPFEFRPAGAALPDGHGLVVRLTEGAGITSTNGATALRFRRAEIQLGPESILQLTPAIVVNQADDVELPVGPIDVTTLERLAGNPPGAGVAVEAFGRFPLRLLAGRFEANVLRGARLRYRHDPESPVIPVPLGSADFPAFDLPLDRRGSIRLPFSGSFTLADGTRTPPTLSIPAQRPLWLALSPDGHVEMAGRAELTFPDGPRFAVEFSAADPRYYLRLETARLRVPPALPVETLLPAPNVGDALSNPALEQATLALDHSLLANRSLAHWIAVEDRQSTTPSAQPAPPHPGIDAVWDFWRAVTASWTVTSLPEPWFAAAQRVGSQAAASDDAKTALECLAVLRAVMRERPGPSPVALQDAVAEARAAVRRILQVAPVDLPVERTKELARLGVAAAARVQAGGGDDTELQAAVGTYVLRCAEHFLTRRLGIQRGVFEAPTISVLRTLRRYEAGAMLAALLELDRCAQQLGIDPALRALPYAEGLAQVAQRIWTDLTARLNAALAQQDRRTFLYLLPEMSDLVRLTQSGLLPAGVAALPDTAQLDSYLGQTLRGLPLEAAADEVYGQRPQQVRDDAERFANLMHDLPPGLALPPEAVRRLHHQLGEALTRLFSLLGSQTLFPVTELLARLEAHLIHEELRLEYALAPDSASLQSQLDATVDRLITRVTANDWGLLVPAAEACLKSAQRLAVPTAARQGPAPSDAAIGNAEARARGRLAQLRNAARLLAALRTSNATRWTALERARPADASQLAADMFLPAGFTVEQAAGELAYDARAQHLRGSLRGRLRFPNFNATLEVLNASLESGGALDLSVAGQLELPPTGTVGVLEIPPRHPAHFAVDRDRHVTLEGGARLRLQNGAAIEGFFSLRDPIYQLGASASGLRFELATHLTRTIPVPDLARLSQLPSQLAAPLNDFLGQLGRTLQPLSSLTELPPVRDPGTPPAFEIPIVTLDTDGLRAATAALAALSNSPVSFGFATLAAAESTVRAVITNANRELGRGARGLAELRTTYERTLQEAQLQLRAATWAQLAEQFCQQADSLLEFVEELAGYIEAQNRGLLGGPPLRFTDQTLLLRNFEEVRSALLSLLAEPGLAWEEAAAGRVIFCALHVEETALRIGLNFEPAVRNALVDGATEVRRRLLQRLGLHPDGTVLDAPWLETTPETRVERLAGQVLGWSDFLQRLGEPPTPLSAFYLNVYAARRLQLIREMRGLLNDEALPAVLREARVIDDVWPRVVNLVAFGERGVSGEETLPLEQLDGSTSTRSIAQDQAAWLNEIASIHGRLAVRLQANDGSDAVRYREYRAGRTRRPAEVQALQQAYEQRRQLGRETPVWRQIEAHSAQLAQAQFRALDQRVMDPAFQLQLANALEPLLELSSLVRLMETTRLPEFATTAVNAELVSRAADALLPRLQVQITALARARQAWWLVQRSTELWQEGWRTKAEADLTAWDRATRQAANTTLATTVELFTTLRNSVTTTNRTFDLRLPGDLIVREVAGQLTLDASVPRLEGQFSGTLEFPESGGARFSIEQLRLATDGSFTLAASADTPIPVGDRTQFTGHLTASGRKDLTHAFAGTLELSGQGQLSFAEGPTLAANVRYRQVIEEQQPHWRLAFDVSATGVQRLGEDAVLFAGNGGLTTGNTAPGVNLRLGGKAAFWRKNRNQPLPADDHAITEELFEIVVDDVQFEITESPEQSQLAIQRGTLRLPSLFYPVDLPAGVQCDPTGSRGPGAEIAIEPTNPLVVTVPHPNGQFTVPSLTGGIEFRRLGFRVPGLPDLAAALCRAELLFESGGPVLWIRDGRLNVPMPTDALVLRLTDARFTLDGLPTGTLSLSEPFNVLDAGGLRVTLLGAPAGQPIVRRFQFPADYTPAERNACAGTSIELFAIPGAPANQRGLRFNGSLEVSVPPEWLMAEDTSGGIESGSPTDLTSPSVGATVCGSFTITPGDRGPQVQLELTRFGLTTSPGVAWRMGPTGVRVLQPSITIDHPASWFQFDPAHPAAVRLAGTLDVNGQFLLTLDNARFLFDQPDRPPRFTVDGLAYQQGTNSLLGKLPVQLTGAALRFQNPGLDLPELLHPTNVALRVSARVQIPPPDPSAQPAVVPVFVGAVENVTVTFDPQTGWPKAPSLDAIELGLVTDALKLPPLDAVGGRFRLGGLQGQSLDDIYLSGRMTAKFQTTQVGLTGVFTWQGPLGVCFDLNAGPVGIPLGPTGFLLTGASGGYSLVNGNGDPCDFASYFEPGPDGFLRLKGTGLPPAPMTWADLRATTERMLALAATGRFSQAAAGDANHAIHATLQESLNASIEATPQEKAPTASSRVESTVRPHEASDAIACPGDCPPRTINLFCQPHPDTNALPERIILKFSAIDEATLNDVLQIRPETFRPAEGSVAIAGQVATRLVAHLRSITPVPNVPGFESLAAGLEGVLTRALSAVTAAIQRALDSPEAMATSAAIYERVRLEAYRGLACPDLTVSVAGRVSYTGLSSFAYVEGRGIASTAGSVGMVGTVNVLGLPVGQGRVFVSATDDQGRPNPSLCGQMGVALGPLELGQVRARLECEGCVTTLTAAVPALLRTLGEPVARQLLARAAPDWELSEPSLEGLLQQLARRPPAEQFGIATRVLEGLTQLSSTELPADLPERLIAILGDRVESLQPALTLCGAVQPRLFGLALGTSPLVDLRARVNRQGYAGSFGFSVAAAAYPFAAFLPATDYAVLSFNHPVPDPVEVLFAGLRGGFASPEAATAWLREAVGNALDRTSYAVTYDLHPFGFDLLTAAGRFIEPELFAHPAWPGSHWRLPEERGLPSRLELLVEAARQHVLGDAVTWSGVGDELPGLFADGTAHRLALADYAQSVRRPLSLRRDYFPHGGFVGAGVLTLPQMLAEAPGAWTPLWQQVVSDPDVLRKVQAATRLINEHLLVRTNTGQIAFYVPAPNPPRLLTHPADSLERGRILTDMNAGAPSAAALAQLSADELRALVPLDVAFLKGELGTEGFNQRLLGLPFGQAEIEVTRAGGVFRLTPPETSWLGAMLRGAGEGAAELEVQLLSAPQESIRTSFEQLREELPNLNAAQLVARVRQELGRSLPKLHLEREVHLPPLPAPLSSALQPVGALRLEAFSPGFNPDAVGDSPEALAQRDGGVLLQGSLSVGVNEPSSGQALELVRLPQATLALQPALGDPLTWPRLVAEFRNVSANLLGWLPLENATVRIDTAGTRPFELEAIWRATDFGGLRLQSPTTANPPPQVRLRLLALANGGTSAQLDLDPLELALPGQTTSSGRTRLALHGTGGRTNRFTVATHGTWSAAATLEGGTPWQLWAGEVEVLRLQTPIAASFAFGGEGPSTWSLSGSLPTPTNWSAVVLPGVRFGNAFGIPLTLAPDVTATVRVDAAGNFECVSSLRAVPPLAGLPAFTGRLDATVNNSGLTLRGSVAGGGSAEVRVFPDGRLSTTSEISVGPLDFRLPNGHRLARIASALDGPLTAAVGPDGATLSGARLSVWLGDNGEARHLSLPDFVYAPETGLFRVAAVDFATAAAGRALPAGRAMPHAFNGALRLGGYTLGTVERMQLARTSSNRFELEIDGALEFPGLAALPLRAVIGSGRFEVALRNAPTSWVVNGVSLEDLTLAASGSGGVFFPTSLPHFELGGSLRGLPAPLDGLRLQGTLSPEGRPELAGSALGNRTLGNFPLNQLGVALGARDISADYAAAIQADRPLGWWRLQGTQVNDSSGRVLGQPANGTVVGNPEFRRPGAFDPTVNRSFRFDGVDDRLEISREARFEALAQGLTVEIWFQRETTGGTTRRALASKGDAWSLGLNESSGALEWSVRLSDGATRTLTTPQRIQDTGWHHVVATHDGRRSEAWPDGKSAGTLSAAGELMQNDLPVRLGAGGAPGWSSWRGGLDECALYDRPLSASAARRHWLAATASLVWSTELRLAGWAAAHMQGYARSDGALYLGVTEPTAHPVGGFPLHDVLLALSGSPDEPPQLDFTGRLASFGARVIAGQTLTAFDRDWPAVRGRVANDGTFQLQANAAGVQLTGFPFELRHFEAARTLTLDRTGSGGPGFGATLNLQVDGRFHFPANLGFVDFQGRVGADGGLSLLPTGPVNLNVGERAFTLGPGQAASFEIKTDRLKGNGRLQLWGREFGAVLDYERNGGASALRVEVDGDTGWVNPPIVAWPHGRLDWLGRFTLQDGGVVAHFTANAAVTAYSPPQRIDQVSAGLATYSSGAPKSYRGQLTLEVDHLGHTRPDVPGFGWFEFNLRP